MKITVYIIGFCFILFNTSSALGQTITSPICFNHSMLVLDSATYNEAVQSSFLSKEFAFAHEKKLTGYQGFYLIGATNYLEIFHSKSVDGEDLKEGMIWICLASLKANYLNQLNRDKLAFMEFESEEDYHYLSYKTNDSTTPISTCEMQQSQYESWTKKSYHDSITFLPVDYNSAAEADSSFNYLMNDVIGIGVSIHPQDSATLIRYLNEIGFDSSTIVEGKLRYSNSDNQFFELHFNTENETTTINRYYIRLNKFVEQKTEIIGQSRIECNGKLAVWIFE